MKQHKSLSHLSSFTNNATLLMIGSIIVVLSLLHVQIVSAELREYCSDSSADYLSCNMSSNCTLGNIYHTKCTINSTVTNCDGDTIFTKTYYCNYCWQLTENVHYTCDYKPSQTGLQSGQDTTIINCNVKRNVICLGSRSFSKVSQVNYSTGKKWSSTFVFSLFLSGFSADRFYLGHAGWGVFKLFTLGGVGLWAIVDLVLVSVGYLGPGDGSIYFG